MTGDSLTVIDGMPTLTSVGRLAVSSSDLVALRLTGLRSVGEIDVSFAGALTELSLPALEGALGELSVAAPVATLDFGAITSVEELVLINTELTNVDAFCSLTAVTSDVVLRDKSFLTNLGGFASLDSVGGSLSVFGVTPSHPALDFCEVEGLRLQSGAGTGTIEQTVGACALPSTCPLVR